jgi:hypothetical protein
MRNRREPRLVRSRSVFNGEKERKKQFAHAAASDRFRGILTVNGNDVLVLTARTRLPQATFRNGVSQHEAKAVN